jgi:hypothetical protein
MKQYAYDDLEKLTPCQANRSRSYWFDGQFWQCWLCTPPELKNVIFLDLKYPDS